MLKYSNSIRSHGTPRGQKGMTLIELMIVIAIGLVLAAIAIGMVSKAREEQRIAEIQNQMMLVTNTVQALAANGDFTGVTADVLCGSGKLPNAWCSGAAGSRVINHAFGGTFAVTAGLLAAPGAAPAVTAASNPKNGAEIVLSNLTPSVCTSLVTATQSAYRGAKTTTGTLRNIDAAPATPGVINTQCTPASGNVVSLSLYVG